jgi:hypothetical protein
MSKRSGVSDVFVGLAMSAAMLFLVACGGSEQEQREEQIEAMARKHGIDADVAVDEAGEVTAVAINNANGTQIGKNLKLPDGFPADVPVPEEWTIMAVSPMQGGYMLNSTSSRPVEDSLAEIRQSLTAEGWAETGFAQPAPMMTQISFAKDDRITNLNLMDTGASRNVQLVTMPRPN